MTSACRTLELALGLAGQDAERSGDLRALDFRSVSRVQQARPTEGRALARVLAEPGRPSVALVCESDGVALAAVAAAACLMGDARVLPGARARHFCVLDPGAVPGLEEQWREFASHRELVVVLPPILQVDDASRMVLDLLAQGTVQAVLRMDPALYHEGLRRDPVFETSLHAMCLQEEIPAEVPWIL